MSTTTPPAPSQSVNAVNGSKNGNGFNGSYPNGQSVKTEIKVPEIIVKRDGRQMSFDPTRIETALLRCFNSLHKESATPLSELTQRAVNIVAAKYIVPSVEQVQDIVEMVLLAAGEYEAAKHYILYRAERAKMRADRPIPDNVREAFAKSDAYFPTQLQKFQYYDKYARFNYDHMRRETWIETVDRSVAFLRDLSGNKLPEEDYLRLHDGILNMKAMPSMRLLAMAGPAALRSNITIYNCSYMPADSLDAFVESLIISMSGCGVGYSVERKYVEQLPRIRRQRGEQSLHFQVPDSADGWAEALRQGLKTWFAGNDIEFDYSLVRPAGAPLITKGGRASGPEPLRQMLNFVRELILSRKGGFLRPVDAHDIMCAVGGAAVSGGVRRTAMIALFDFDDEEMRQCKNVKNIVGNEQRWNANNSAVWPDRDLTQAEITRYLLEMVESGSGEPGIFNRRAANNTIPERRQPGDFGTNPCVTTDTWVAVADGRGRARMGDLVKDGKDVDVFTVKDDKLIIRKMRNPRKTGTQVPIYRVTFADGAYMRVTPNHKFVRRDGMQVQAVDLKPNDAIISMKCYSYKKQGLPQTEKVAYDETSSYRMLQFGRFRKSEHRFIYQHHTGEELIGTARHIHHVDFDSRHNSIENLELVTAEEHAQLHRGRMLGENNPVHNMTDEWRAALSRATTGLANGNAKDVTNEELEQQIAHLARSLKHIPTLSEYQKYAKKMGFPQTFSQYRQSYFGGNVNDALRTISTQHGIFVTAYEARLREKTDLPIIHRNGRSYVIRQCEVCGSDFEVRLNRREQACCSYTCSSKLWYRQHGSDARSEAISDARRRNHDTVRERQIRAYNNLMFELGRHPLKKEWQEQCRIMGVSPEISRVSSPFRYWADLEEAATSVNHRVVSVESDGFEDVYTGTVDETHTYFAVGCEARDSKDRVEMRYVLNVQCGEIVLRPYQFCNLSITVARPEDTFEDLKEKVELATIIGTIQSAGTHFPGLRPQWSQNCEEERLLGVDINGQMDSKLARDPEVQVRLREHAVETNARYADMIGINRSVAVTTVKPSGNSSQLLNCSPGVHPRWAPYYVRNVRVGVHTPVFKVLSDAGVPLDPENGQTAETANTWVAHFPVKAPENAITRNDRTALEQCEYWLQVKNNWTEHNPSVTITYQPDEVLDIIKWVWEHQDKIGGMTFLPAFDAQYDQMPYEEISAEEYTKRAATFPNVDFSKLWRYEQEDYTTAAQELACLGGHCDII